MAKNSAIEWTDAQKDRARSLVNVDVRFGRLPHPNNIPCFDCGHVWSPGERRHEYDHPRGYDQDHIYDVEPVCTLCHAKRDSAKIRQTECVHGHPYTSDNTRLRANGTRECVACRRLRDIARRPAEWWREYRTKRKARG